MSKTIWTCAALSLVVGCASSGAKGGSTAPSATPAAAAGHQCMMASGSGSMGMMGGGMAPMKHEGSGGAGMMGGGMMMGMRHDGGEMTDGPGAAGGITHKGCQMMTAAPAPNAAAPAPSAAPPPDSGSK